ncbi:MAG: hypothetical protein K6A61_07065 [Butyrivibrio sp.]|nr:hypothetical protein [Butyrivibrio sp.]
MEIKAKTTYIRSSEAFYNRIMAGYSLMAANISEEDLLHITSTPPEIYVMESGGMTSILSNNLSNETNIYKVNILNNVLNRILLSADMDLTYQDRVFITDALYKLGIKDDRKFMKTFYRIAGETRNTNNLINLYLENGGNLSEAVKELETMQKELIKTESSFFKNEKENYLYSSVMKRLQTEAVYQIVSNFNKTVQSNEIDAREFSISDQTYVARNIFLKMLREGAGEQADELIFFNNNIYEEEALSENTEIGSVKNIINSAVLLELLKSIYHTAFDRLYKNKDTFYRFEDTFYRSSDRTILRLVNRAENNYFKTLETDRLIEKTSRLSKSEIELLLKEISPDMTDEELESITENIILYNLRNEKRRLLNETLMHRSIENTKLISEETKDAKKSKEPEQETITKESSLEITDEEIRRITESVNLINIQNEKRRLQYEKELQKIQEEQKDERGQQGIEQTRKDALLALTDPKKLAERLKENREKLIYKQNSVINEIKHIIPAEYQDVITILNKINEGDQSIVQNNIVRNAEIGELMQDINTFVRPQMQEMESDKERDLETEAFWELIEQKTKEEVNVKGSNHKPAPVETVHRDNRSLSMEEINEQLDIIQKNISRQIGKNTENSSIIEKHTTNTTEVVTGDTQVNRLRTRDIEQLIENGVRSNMAAISDQVMNRIEKQMRNEKVRRGY